MKKILFALSVFSLLWAACQKDENVNGDELEMNEPPAVTTPYTVIKTGKFNGASGYPANGTAQLVKDSSNMYSIILEKDFSTTYATGSVTMYLSKTPIPTFADANTFVKLAVINKNGFHRFALAAPPSDQLVNVVVWCQPAGVKFGHAELK